MNAGRLRLAPCVSAREKPKQQEPPKAARHQRDSSASLDFPTGPDTLCMCEILAKSRRLNGRVGLVLGRAYATTARITLEMRH
jgi:hypothetical protein